MHGNLDVYLDLRWQSKEGVAQRPISIILPSEVLLTSEAIVSIDSTMQAISSSISYTVYLTG